MKLQPTTIIAILVAALALAVANTAAAATFQISGPGTVKLTQEGSQKLEFSGGSQFTCEKISGSVSVSTLLTVSINLLITLSGKCEAFGSSLTVSTGEILFNSNGSIRLGRTDKFVITSAIGKCSIQFLSENESAETLLGTVKYTNNANGTITGTITKLGIPTFTRGGATCGASGTGKASYTGSFVSELEGGRISVEK
jgi:hypothetical protein